jgi:hypothetical protein
VSKRLIYIARLADLTSSVKCPSDASSTSIPCFLLYQTTLFTFQFLKSTVDQIQSLRQLQEKTMNYGVSTLHIFIDFSAICDTISRKKSLSAMNEFKIPKKLNGLVTAALKHIKCKVKMENTT